MKYFFSVSTLFCLLIVACFLSCAVVVPVFGQELQDLNQLVGKKVVLQRIQFCEPGTLHYTMNHAGETATLLSVTPKVYRSKTMIGRGIPYVKDPEMRKLAEDGLKSGIVLVQLKDGTKLDTCWPISPGTASSWVELAEKETPARPTGKLAEASMSSATQQPITQAGTGSPIVPSSITAPSTPPTQPTNMSSSSAHSAQSAKPAFRSIRQMYLDQLVIIGGPIINERGKDGLLDWNVAHQNGDLYEEETFNLLAGKYREKIARVIAVQLRMIRVGTQQLSAKTNALGEAISDDDKINPFFELVVRFDDGQLALTSGYAGTIPTAVKLASDQSKREEEMSKNLPLIIGSSLYAAGYSKLYQPDTTLEEIVNQRGILKQLGVLDVPLLTPLVIIAAKYVASEDGVVIKVKLPNGLEALSFTHKVYLDNATTEAPFLEKISGSLLTGIPKFLTTQEIDAIKQQKIFRGMSKDAVDYALGAPQKENDWGASGKQLIYFGSIFVYVDKQGKVVDWQILGK